MKLFNVPWASNTTNKQIINDAQAEAGIIYASPSVSAEVNGALNRTEQQLQVLSDEVSNVITGAGIIINPADSTQLEQAINSKLGFPDGYIKGGVPSYNNATTIDFSSIKARSSDDTTDIIGGAFSKTLAPFVAGSGNGGLVSGAIANNQKFKVSAMVYTGKSFNVNAQDNAPWSISFSGGNNMYMLGDQNERVFWYTLTNPYDLGVAPVLAGQSAVLPDNKPTGLRWKDNTGIRYYLVGQQTRLVRAYDCATPFNPATAVQVATFNVLPQTATPQGLEFSADGSKMIIHNQVNTLFSYNLSTPWDISTAVLGSSYSLGITTNDANGIRFNDDGKRLFVVDNQNDRILQFDLDVAYDITTINNNFSAPFIDISGQDNTPFGLAFSEDGLTAFMSGDATNTIYQYSMDNLRNASIHSFSLYNSTTNAYDICHDLSSVLSLIPAGFDKNRRIGSFKLDSSGSFIPFTAYETTGNGIDFMFNFPILERSGVLSIPSGQVSYLTISTPSGFKISPKFSIMVADAETFRQALVDLNNNAIIYISRTAPEGQTNTSVISNQIRTNLISQIGFTFRSDVLGPVGATATAVEVHCNGYIDERND